MQIFDCMGVSVPNRCVVQESIINLRLCIKIRMVKKITVFGITTKCILCKH